MKIIQRGKITYFIKEESIIAGINNFQWQSYNVYSLQNRKPFYGFKKSIIESKEGEYDNVISLIRLSQKYGLIASAAQKPKEAYDL